MELPEAVIRAWTLPRRAAGCWSNLLAATSAARGCRAAKQMRQSSSPTGYKVIETALGPVTVMRAGDHGAACGHGLAPGMPGLGVEAHSMSPGCGR